MVAKGSMTIRAFVFLSLLSTQSESSKESVKSFFSES